MKTINNSCRYKVWLDNNDDEPQDEEYFITKKSALQYARKLDLSIDKNNRGEKLVVIQKGKGQYRGYKSLMFAIWNNRFQRIKTDLNIDDRKKYYNCLPYKYFKKEVGEVYNNSYKPKLHNNNYYGYITNKLKKYNNYELYNEFMKLVKYLHENHYKLYVEKDYHNDYLFCRFKKGVIMGGFTTKNDYSYGTINGRIAVDHSGCFNKWSQCPISINLYNLDFKVLEQQVEYMKSKEGFDFSNEYFDSNKFINDHENTPEYLEYLIRHKIELKTHRAIMARDIFCPYCYSLTVNISKLEDEDYVYDYRTDKCFNCNKEFNVDRAGMWEMYEINEDRDIRHADNNLSYVTLEFEDSDIQEYYNSIRRDINCPECNNNLEFNSLNPLRRKCNSCDTEYEIFPRRSLKN